MNTRKWHLKNARPSITLCIIVNFCPPKHPFDTWWLVYEVDDVPLKLLIQNAEPTVLLIFINLVKGHTVG